ncbi:MAG TPA: hypothetical protein VHW05_13475 [Phenylobacterium sp.]|jgi:hypothetical protein|nr:hypothetical protein [Phenylobacterium sp.]
MTQADQHSAVSLARAFRGRLLSHVATSPKAHPPAPLVWTAEEAEDAARLVALARAFRARLAWHAAFNTAWA